MTYCGTCKTDPCLVNRYDGVEPICCHDMVRYGHCQHEQPEQHPTWGGKRSGAGRPKSSLTKLEAIERLTEVLERADIAKDDTLPDVWDKLAKASLANFKARIANRQADIEQGAAEIRAFYNK